MAKYREVKGRQGRGGEKGEKVKGSKGQAGKWVLRVERGERGVRTGEKMDGEKEGLGKGRKENRAKKDSGKITVRGKEGRG